MINNPLQNLAVKQKIEALSTQHKVLLFIVTFVLLIGGFYFLAYKDLSENIERLQGQVTQKENELNRLKAAAKQVADLEKKLAASEEEFAQLLKLLPDQREIPGLLESVSRLGAEVGLENILFQPQPERPEDFYAAIPVKLDLRGTYHEVGVFLDSVSKLDRILKVQSMNLTRQKNNQKLQVDCTIETYRFVENAPPAPADKKKTK